MESAVAIAEVAARRSSRRRTTLAIAAIAAIVAVSISVGVAVEDAAGDSGLVALARGLLVGAPLAVGLHAWYGGWGRRFGLLLIVAGAACFVSTLAESSDASLYSVGRLGGWAVEAFLIYLFLAFPTGRLHDGLDRGIVTAMVAVVLVMYLPRLFLAESFEVPSPYTSCADDCPPNAFFALDSEPAIVATVLRPLGVALVFAVTVAVVVVLWQRLRAATPLRRRLLAPVLAFAIARAGLLGVTVVARELEPVSWPVEIAAWLLALAVPAVAVAYFLGLLQWRLFAERALQSLAACLRELPNPVTLRQAFADAFSDPSIEIVFPVGEVREGWLDSSGKPVSLPEPWTGRRVSEVRNRGAVVAAIVHDEGLEGRPELVEAGAAMAAVVLDNQRLGAQSEASIRELQRSRARMASSAESERRRIERDLHDGAQQRLVALRIELELAEDVVRQDPERGAARLRELEGELDEALEELRSLAHGVYPPLLADRGLSDALRSVASRSAIPVALETANLGRYRPDVESAVYFCVLEALQNALKHATGARRVAVRVGAGPLGELHFSVRDDGAGVEEIRAGAGITNMQDRLAAVGGEVTVTSTRGVGTHVRGRVPASPLPAA
jgi:signal transduction histidine kinase